jgi:asparagine synthase (glutamine-hydrolysing)
MCGIAGLVSFARPMPVDVATAMTEAIHHRGPDEGGVESLDEGRVVLGMRRLSIIDVEGGHQPMWDEARRHCLVFNGEIYNHGELREQLVALGHRFATDHSDTETVVHGFEEWGADLFRRLDGMFALAIWSEDRRELVLARDRAGEKPLYVGRLASGDWAFGSELKALLTHPDLPRDVDPAAVEQYLAFDYVVGPRTILAAVQKLRAGHFAVLSDAGLRTEAYWRLRFDRQPADEHAAVERLDQLLERSVRMRMISDVPIGLFLSGGLDSTTVGYYMRQASDHVRAFTIGFEERGFDETEHARLAADHLGLEHHVEILSEDRVLGLVPRVTELLDEPMADPSVLPTHLLSLFTRRYATVALGGDGSDELLMGYRTYQALKIAGAADRTPLLARRILARSARRVPDRAGALGKARRLIAGLDLPADRRLLARLGSFGGRARDVIADDLRRQLPTSVFEEPLAEIRSSRAGSDGRSEETIAAYVRAYLQEDILVKVDRASMAASLEVRAPFLAPALIDWAGTVDPAMKLRGLERKRLLRVLMRGRIPDQLIDRQKQGFGAPMDAWFRGPLATLADETLDPDTLRRGGLVDPSAVRRILVEHREGRADHGNRLWALVQLELWRERWLRSA